MKEWISAFKDGPGIVVIRGTFESQIVDSCTEVFNQILKEEKESGKAAGDHFGTNSRAWNALEKLAV